MQRQIRLDETLDFYDKSLLVLATDQFGVRYLCLLVEEQHEFDKWVCAAISPKRLAALRHGELDVRSVYEKPETDELFCFQVIDYTRDDIPISSLHQAIQDEWLPAPGYFLELEEIEGELKEVQDAQQG